LSQSPQVPLGEVLRHRKEFIQIDDLARYKRPRAQLHAQGVVLRDEIEGAAIKTKSQQVCHAKELLVAEIDAKVGGYGLVPDELEGAIVSSHYFLFTVDVDRLDPRFLGWYVKTPTFGEQIEAQGSTNYAAIRPQHVLGYTMPLPPIEEQRRVVRRIERLASISSKVLNLVDQVDLQTEALARSVSRHLIGADVGPGWLALGDVIQDLENGWSPACHDYPAAEGEWGVIKLGAVSFGRFNSSENKALPRELAPKLQYEIKAGDLLVSRANTLELVGASALVRETPPKLMLCDKVFRVILRSEGVVAAEYLDYVLKSPSVRKQIEANATGTSPTMKNIAKSKLMSIRVPVCSHSRQRRIVRAAEAIADRLREVREARYCARHDAEALVPSAMSGALSSRPIAGA
jgi:type I restriction enzyme S subunit